MTTKLLRAIAFLTLVIVQSCCYIDEDLSTEPICLQNNSSEAVACLFSFYESDAHTPMNSTYSVCDPGETTQFEFGRHKHKPIAVKIFKVDKIDFKNIDNTPVEPLATYLFTNSILEEHDWRSTYPPSEPWMQCGIKETETNRTIMLHTL